MSGVGPLEILLIVAIAALLFGAPVVTFLVGYGLGRRKASAEKEAPPSASSDEGADVDG